VLPLIATGVVARDPIRIPSSLAKRNRNDRDPISAAVRAGSLARHISSTTFSADHGIRRQVQIPVSSGSMARTNVYRMKTAIPAPKVIGKFFLSSRKKDVVKAVSRLTREFDNLSMMRDYGLADYQHHVVRRWGATIRWNALVGYRILRGATAQRSDTGGHFTKATMPGSIKSSRRWRISCQSFTTEQPLASGSNSTKTATTWIG